MSTPPPDDVRARALSLRETHLDCLGGREGQNEGGNSGGGGRDRMRVTIVEEEGGRHRMRVTTVEEEGGREEAQNEGGNSGGGGSETGERVKTL